jgi:hypothetical protein
MKLRAPALRRPSPAAVIALLALFVALGGPAEAAKLINGARIKRGTVTSKQVKDRSLSTRDLSKGTRRALTKTPAHSVGSGQLKDGSVGAAQLQPGSITAAAMAANSVTGGDIIDKQVGNADIGDNAVSAGKIATGAVRKAELGSGAVGTSELGNNVVTGEKLVNGAVTPGKLGADAVTGANVANGSLGAADIADFSGTVSPAFGSIGAAECQSVSVTAPGLGAGQSAADDLLLATPPTSWPAGVTLQARPVSETSIALVACSVDGQAHSPAGTIRVLGIDQ